MMSDIELLLNLSSEHVYPTSSASVGIIDEFLNDSIRRADILDGTDEARQLQTLQAEMEKINRLSKLEYMSSNNQQTWLLPKNTVSIPPSNTPVQSPLRNRNSHSTPVTAVAVTSLQSMKSAVLDSDFTPRVLFDEDSQDVQDINGQIKESNRTLTSVSELLKIVKYNDSSSIVQRYSDFVSSSPPGNTTYKNRTINTSVVSNNNFAYGNNLNFTPISSFDCNANGSYAADTTLIDSSLMGDILPEFKVRSSTSRSQHRMNTLLQNRETIDQVSSEKSISNILPLNLSGNFVLDDINQNEKISLSSSPISKFEARFPEPGLITDLFGLDENDFINHRSKKQESITELKTPVQPQLNKSQKMNEIKLNPSTVTIPSSDQRTCKKSSKYDELISETNHATVSVPTFYNLQHQRDSSLRSPVVPKPRKPFRLEVNPENIILQEGESRLLRDANKFKKIDSYKEIEPEFIDDSPCSKRVRTLKLQEEKPFNVKIKAKKGAKIQGRSKNGCWTCRIRKKKCSEEKPSCAQCKKLDLKCDGYLPIRPPFMADHYTQRKKLDEIKAHTTLRKKVGVLKNLRKE